MKLTIETNKGNFDLQECDFIIRHGFQNFHDEGYYFNYCLLFLYQKNVRSVISNLTKIDKTIEEKLKQKIKQKKMEEKTQKIDFTISVVAAIIGLILLFISFYSVEFILPAVTLHLIAVIYSCWYKLGVKEKEDLKELIEAKKEMDIIWLAYKEKRDCADYYSIEGKRRGLPMKDRGNVIYAVVEEYFKLKTK